mmetsp:Transcript_7002/g.7118  ORF Transcript_7002/g.7118 Transcript_7002/m.7118 type:complete len:466 (-) Transcript_7002:71-1468(-)
MRRWTILFQILMVITLSSFKQIHSLVLKKRFLRSISAMSNVAKLMECDMGGLKESASVLQAGGLVAFPTETVYGLGANALNDTSVKSIFAAKKRPSTDPLIVHILSKNDIYDLFDFEDIDKTSSKAKLVCECLADNFWPGPLTVIFKAKSSIPLSVTAGSGFVGLRSPRHPIARQLLEAAGLPIAAPSANRFGHVSPTSAEHVMFDLGEENITILKDNIPLSGGCVVGIESTVCRVSMCGDTVSILRCGAVTSEDIAQALRLNSIQVAVVIENEKAIKKPTNKLDIKDVDSPAVAPGQMIKHYAPDIPTYILSASRTRGTTSDVTKELQPLLVLDETSAAININEAFVIDFGGKLGYTRGTCAAYYDLSVEGKAEEACNQIFKILRKAEDPALGFALPSDIGEIDKRQIAIEIEGDLSTTIEINKSGTGVKVVLLPDLRIEAEETEMIRALWERLHRAASGVFVQ